MADPIAPGVTPLDALQRWMLRVVTHERGLEAGLEAAEAEGLLPGGAKRLRDVVPGNERMTPEEQLQIYAFAYFERIREVLAGEVPTVEHLLGEEAFASLMRRYLRDCPSSTWTIDRVGAPLAGWLEAEGQRLGDPALLAAADMARVERAMDEVWDDPPAARAPADTLASVPLEAWADARLELVPALRLLSLGHVVTPAMNAARAGEPAEVPVRERSWVVVYRRAFRRYRLVLTEPQFVLLSALREGNTLGAALMEVAALPGVELEALFAEVGRWFERWMGLGLVARVAVIDGV